jgi:NAD-dependent dihydropyrimidine dehydrogenase PreA subunit
VAHLTAKSSYGQLTERLNKFPTGAAESETLYRILSHLFTEEEARQVSLLPVAPFRLDAAARAWKVDELEARRRLDALADKALIVDTRLDGGTLYFLPPPMAGFFEFSLMRTRGGHDKAALSQLYAQYLDDDDAFTRQLYEGGDTQLGRMLVHEGALPDDDTLEVLDRDRATAMITEADGLAVGLCYCRHKMDHHGEACDAPQSICMGLNASADVLVRHDLGRRIDVAEGLYLLEQAREAGLVQFAENVQRRPHFICNCCRCCCETLVAARRFAHLQPVHTTAFIPRIDADRCNACGACTGVCPVECIAIEEHGPDGNGGEPRTSRAVVDERRCLGCGVCVPACKADAVHLANRPERIITPVDSAHRTVLMAIERGKLQNLLFAEQARGSHRALAAVFGVLFELPPTKQLLANRQLKSRYLGAIFSRKRFW